MGRNVFRDSGFRNWDFSVAKNWKFTERFRAQFRAEFFNVLNHPNFDCLDSDLSSGTFATAQCLTPFGLGAPTSRIMSLGLRLAF